MTSGPLAHLILAATRLVDDVAGCHERERAEFAAGYRLGFAAGRDIGRNDAEQAWHAWWAPVRDFALRTAARRPHTEQEHIRWDGPRARFGAPRPTDREGTHPMTDTPPDTPTYKLGTWLRVDGAPVEFNVADLHLGPAGKAAVDIQFRSPDDHTLTAEVKGQHTMIPFVLDERQFYIIRKALREAHNSPNVAGPHHQAFIEVARTLHAQYMHHLGKDV